MIALIGFYRPTGAKIQLSRGGLSATPNNLFFAASEEADGRWSAEWEKQREANRGERKSGPSKDGHAVEVLLNNG